MKMQNTEMEFVTFDASDVIATSPVPKTFIFGGLYNGTDIDATIRIDDGKTQTTIFNAADYASLTKAGRKDKALEALKGSLDGNFLNNNTWIYWDDQTSTRIGILLRDSDADGITTAGPDYNGTYEWVAAQSPTDFGYFKRQN